MGQNQRATPGITVQLRNPPTSNSPRVTSQRLAPVSATISKKTSLFNFFRKNKETAEPEQPQQPEETTQPDPARRRLTIDMGNVSPLQTSEGSQNSTTAEDDESNLRASKGAFTVETTTVKKVSEIQSEIERVLNMLLIPFKKSSKGTKYTCMSQDSKLQVSIEICKISKLEGFKGIKFKRVGGDVWKYKDMYKSITGELRL